MMRNDITIVLCVLLFFATTGETSQAKSLRINREWNVSTVLRWNAPAIAILETKLWSILGYLSMGVKIFQLLMWLFNYFNYL